GMGREEEYDNQGHVPEETMANEGRAGQAGAEEERAGQGGADEGRVGQVGVVEGRASEVGAAMPAAAAGGASGLFSSAQQLGGAVSAALLGTVFFGWVTSGHAFAAATTHTGPYAVGAFTLCALLLPRTAVSDALIGTDQLNRFPRRLSRGVGVHVDAGRAVDAHHGSIPAAGGCVSAGSSSTSVS